MSDLMKTCKRTATISDLEIAEALRFVIDYGYRAPILVRLSAIRDDGTQVWKVCDRLLPNSSTSIARALQGRYVSLEGLPRPARLGDRAWVTAGSVAILEMIERDLITEEEANEIIEERS